MNVKEIAKKLNIRLKKDALQSEIEKNDKYLAYLAERGEKLTENQKEAIALTTLSGRSIESITLDGRRSIYQIGCNLRNVYLIRYYYDWR